MLAKYIIDVMKQALKLFQKPTTTKGVSSAASKVMKAASKVFGKK